MARRSFASTHLSKMLVEGQTVNHGVFFGETRREELDKFVVDSILVEVEHEAGRT